MGQTRQVCIYVKMHTFAPDATKGMCVNASSMLAQSKQNFANSHQPLF